MIFSPLAALLDFIEGRMRRSSPLGRVLLGACYAAIAAFGLFVAYAEWAHARREAARPPVVEVVPGAVGIEAAIEGAPIR